MIERTIYIEFDHSIRTIRELNLTESHHIPNLFNYDDFLQIQLKILKFKNKINSAKIGLVCWGWPGLDGSSTKVQRTIAFKKSFK